MELSSEKNYVWRVLVEDESGNKRSLPNILAV
jgi:hypothetical protein